MGYENALKFGLFKKVLKNTCRAAEMWKKSAFYAHSFAHKKVVFIVDGTLCAIAISSVNWNEKWNNKKKTSAFNEVEMQFDFSVSDNGECMRSAKRIQAIICSYKEWCNELWHRQHYDLLSPKEVEVRIEWEEHVCFFFLFSF